MDYNPNVFYPNKIDYNVFFRGVIHEIYNFVQNYLISCLV